VAAVVVVGAAVEAEANIVSVAVVDAHAVAGTAAGRQAAAGPDAEPAGVASEALAQAESSVAFLGREAGSAEVVRVEGAHAHASSVALGPDPAVLVVRAFSGAVSSAAGAVRLTTKAVSAFFIIVAAGVAHTEVVLVAVIDADAAAVARGPELAAQRHAHARGHSPGSLGEANPTVAALVAPAFVAKLHGRELEHALAGVGLTDVIGVFAIIVGRTGRHTGADLVDTGCIAGIARTAVRRRLAADEAVSGALGVVVDGADAVGWAVAIFGTARLDAVAEGVVVAPLAQTEAALAGVVASALLSEVGGIELGVAGAPRNDADETVRTLIVAGAVG